MTGSAHGAGRKLLKVGGLSVAIGETQVLNDVSLEIARGRVFGLVGESGSGKSMTALALMQLLPEGGRATGQARFDGQSLLDLDEPAMCALRGNDIGMIFQEPMTALNPVQTIGDQVAETLIIHKAATRADARDIALERLRRVGLDPARFSPDRFPHELSGGQRQRVCIAMAIALRPRLLIADEPTTALDVTTQAQILDLLKGLVADEDMALMLITHDLAVVAGLADHVAVMQHGRIVETDRTEALFRRRAHPYTRQLFAASGHIPDRQPQIADEATPVLAVDGLIRDYALPRTSLWGPRPKFRAVDKVSLTIRPGESVGLVGESGCGKSTLTRAILGLERSEAGEITLNGQVVDGATRIDGELRRNMQVVFQDPFGSFNPRHKVGRLVSEPFHLIGGRDDDTDRQVAEALEAVGMFASDSDKFIHEFSGGQRQRIAIARAIVIRPQLVILDEAVSALDVSIRAQILDLLAGLQAEMGLSYLFISHDLSVVRAITDQVLVMKAGQIVEEGPTRRVFENPSHDYTRTLIAATPQIPADWVALS